MLKAMLFKRFRTVMNAMVRQNLSPDNSGDVPDGHSVGDMVFGALGYALEGPYRAAYYLGRNSGTARWPVSPAEESVAGSRLVAASSLPL
jgi:hypothetical protein